MKYFDFKDALDYMLSGDTVGLIINGLERHYYYRNGIFYRLIPNMNTLGVVKKFYIDSILSNEWFIVNGNSTL